jgi:hypothetical protein
MTGEVPRSRWFEVLAEHPYAREKLSAWSARTNDPADQIGRDHALALDSYLSAHDHGISPGGRLGLLRQSMQIWQRLASLVPGNPSVVLCLARASHDLGHRSAALDLLVRLGGSGPFPTSDTLDLPFIPPLARFDRRPVRGAWIDWLRAAVFEAIEIWGTFSSYFSVNTVQRLVELAANPNVSLAVHKRLALAVLRSGEVIQVPRGSALLQQSEENLNPNIWRALVDTG